ncbi:hypothetical protein PoB_007129600 [Plakobranchus ocellatus]|uniref:Secreted protein n=1 Tax=Plakobranchus ocellatus TaxID=259542 RepID=A0AAV4DLP8_9GAST|nr:hypothetical protein PoB_007129600 [Plakobranchus ocellatus]
MRICTTVQTVVTLLPAVDLHELDAVFLVLPDVWFKREILHRSCKYYNNFGSEKEQGNGRAVHQQKWQQLVCLLSLHIARSINVRARRLAPNKLTTVKR